MRFTLRTDTLSAALVSVALLGMAHVGSAQAPSFAPPALDPLTETSYARYATPAECAWSHQWLENMYWRDKRPDTVFHGKEGTPYEASTQKTVGDCVSHDAVANVAERDVIGLAEAALADGQPDKADAAFARLTKLVAAAPVEHRAWSYYQAVSVYLDASEPQIHRAQGYIAKLDALGAPAAVEQMLAYSDLASEAQRRDSVPLWDQATQHALAASKLIAGDTRKQFAFEAANVYTLIATLKERQNDIAAARTMLQAGRSDLIALRPRVAIVFNSADAWLAMQGEAPGPVTATQWGNAGPTGTVHPVNGKPAIVVFVSQNCGSFCYNDYGVLRRLFARYPASQLDCILVTNTEGYSRGKLLLPDSEMTIIQDYFVNFMKFPAAISMWKGVYARRADGRLMMQPTGPNMAYRPPHDPFHITIGVVDKTGVIRMYTTLATHNEIMLNDVIQSVM